MNHSTTECPFHKLRADLPTPLPPQIAKLPVDERGYPVPFFVQYIDGKPDFRVMSAKNMKACKIAGLCWVCGQPLGARYAFVIGPMCAINRVSQEPPSHLDCAEWSVRACPFMTKPQMKRREDEVSREGMKNVPGVHIERNPGVTLIWETNHYHVFNVGPGQLIEVGPPLAVSWWREGRAATRAEVIESIESGLPALSAACDTESPKNRPLAHAELIKKTGEAMKLIPEA